MNQNIHIIQKQQVKLKISAKENTLAIQQRFERLIEEQLLPRLEPVFDRLAGPDEWIEIDALEINLGNLKPKRPTSEWLEQTYQTYVAALEKQIQEKNVQKSSSTDQTLEVLDFFLERGYFPWWAGDFKLEARLRSIIPNNGSKVLQLLQKDRARKRWIRQFSQVLHQHLLQALNVTLPVDLTSWHKVFNEIPLHTLSNIYWETTWKNINAWKTSPQDWLAQLFLDSLKILPQKAGLHQLKNPKAPQLTKVVAHLFPITLDQLTPKISDNKIQTLYWGTFKENAHHLPSDFPSNWTKLFIQKVLQIGIEKKERSVLFEAIASTKSLPSEFKEQLLNIVQTWNQNLPAQPEKAKHFDQLLPGGSPENRGDNKIMNLTTEGEKSKNPLEMDNTKQTGVYRNTTDREHKKMSSATLSEEGIFIVLAGIVLIHPFLPSFFERLGYLKEGEFKDESTQERAVHMLYFLATGLEHPQEQETVLLKLLCGITFDIPIARNLDLNDTEKKEAMSLLEAVISHWPVMEGSSLDDLRGTFFIRDGKLKTGEMGWYLAVEVKTFDILLGKLPWGLSPIMHSWMNQMLWVDW